MFFNVKELEVRKRQFEADLAPGQIDFSNDHLRQVTPLHTNGVAELVSSSIGEIRLAGTLNVEMEGVCDRCLEPASFPVESQFDLFYRPVIETEPGQEIQIDQDEIEMGFYEKSGIDLNEVLREQILLALPMQQVCSEECKGICQQCGKNLNRSECDCKATVADDRWAPLREAKLDPRNKPHTQ